MKIDPYNHRTRYENWKRKGFIEGVSKFNSDIIVEYLSDMESGFNVARRGGVSYIRLNTLNQRMGYVARGLEKVYGKERLVDITDREIVAFFKMMRDGQIQRGDGGRYISVPDYAAVFKAFWHWYQRIESEKGRTVRDITRYIDNSPIQRPGFTYSRLMNSGGWESTPSTNTGY